MRARVPSAIDNHNAYIIDTYAKMNKNWINLFEYFKPTMNGDDDINNYHK